MLERLDAARGRSGLPTQRQRLHACLAMALRLTVPARLRELLTPADIARIATNSDAGWEWHRLASPLANVVEFYVGPIGDVACITIGYLLLPNPEILQFEPTDTADLDVRPQTVDAVVARADYLLDSAIHEPDGFNARIQDASRELLTGARTVATGVSAAAIRNYSATVQRATPRDPGGGVPIIIL